VNAGQTSVSKQTANSTARLANGALFVGASESWGIAVPAMCLAFAINAFLAIPVFSGQALYLGQTVSLLVLLTRGWRSALLVSLGAAAGLWWAGDNVSGPALILLEIASVAALLHHRVPIVPGVLLFRILLGAPACYLVASLTGNGPEQLMYLEILLQTTGALLSASLTAVVFQLSIHRGLHLRSLRMQHIGLSRQAFAMAVTLVMLPAVSVAVLLLDRSVAIFGADLYGRMQRDAFEYAALTELYLSQHRKSLELLAKRHPGAPDEQLFRDLEQLQRGMSGFLTMIATDDEGLVVHGAPRHRFAAVLALPKEQRSVADRGYFQDARDSGVALISDGVLGRGFGSDPIVAVSAPLQDSEGDFLGVVEGSLNLPSLGSVGATYGEDSLVVVTDSAGQVVAASPNPASGEPFLTLLSTPTFALDARHPVVDIPQLTLSGSQYFVAKAVTADGWTVYGLADTAVVTRPLEQFMFAFGLGLLGLLVLGGIISAAFTASITRPLHTLIQQIRDPAILRITLPPVQRNSPEIVQVEGALDQARQLNISFRQRVEQEIAEKTQQLSEANQALQALTIEDPLTGINNRRGLELGLRAKMDVASREKLELMVAMIDIDHFKSVNDRFGHAAGDECLCQLAESLQVAFRRRGDLIARYGGEEFTVVIVSTDGAAQIERLEQFRRNFEALRFHALPADTRLTVSIGVTAAIPDPGASTSSLLETADQALYASKHSGRNCLMTA
jgi:diguanylate cyclase (GGDEF)-like protein